MSRRPTLAIVVPGALIAAVGLGLLAYTGLGTVESANPATAVELIQDVSAGFSEDLNGCDALIAVDPPLSLGSTSTVTVSVAGCDSASEFQPFLSIPKRYTATNVSPISHTVIAGLPPVDPNRQYILWEDQVPETTSLTLTATIEADTVSEKYDLLYVGVWRESSTAWSGPLASTYLGVGASANESTVSHERPDTLSLLFRNSIDEIPALISDTDVSLPLSVGMLYTGSLQVDTVMTTTFLISNTHDVAMPITGTIRLPTDWSVVSGTLSISETLDIGEQLEHDLEIQIDEVPCYWTMEADVFIPETLKASGYDDFEMVIDGTATVGCTDPDETNTGSEDQMHLPDAVSPEMSRLASFTNEHTEGHDIESVRVQTQQSTCARDKPLDPSQGENCSSSVFSVLPSEVLCDDGVLHVAFVTVSLCSTNTPSTGLVTITGYGDTSGSASAMVARTLVRVGPEQQVETLTLASEESMASIRVESDQVSFSCVSISSTCDTEDACFPAACPLPGGGDPSPTPTGSGSSTPTPVLPTRTPTPTPDPTGSALIPRVYVGRMWRVPEQGPTATPGTPSPTPTPGGPTPEPTPIECGPCTQPDLCTPVGWAEIGPTFRIMGTVQANGEALGSLRLRVLSVRRGTIKRRPSKVSLLDYTQELSVVMLDPHGRFDTCIPQTGVAGAINWIMLEVSAADFEDCELTTSNSDNWTPVSVKAHPITSNNVYRAYSRPIYIKHPAYEHEECPSTKILPLGTGEVSQWPKYNTDSASAFFLARMIACDNRQLLLDEGVELRDSEFTTDLTYPRSCSLGQGCVLTRGRMRISESSGMSGFVVTHEIGHILQLGLGESSSKVGKPRGTNA